MWAFSGWSLYPFLQAVQQIWMLTFLLWAQVLVVAGPTLQRIFKLQDTPPFWEMHRNLRPWMQHVFTIDQHGKTLKLLIALLSIAIGSNSESHWRDQTQLSSFGFPGDGQDKLCPNFNELSLDFWDCQRFKWTILNCTSLCFMISCDKLWNYYHASKHPEFSQRRNSLHSHCTPQRIPQESLQVPLHSTEVNSPKCAWLWQGCTWHLSTSATMSALDEYLLRIDPTRWTTYIKGIQRPRLQIQHGYWINVCNSGYKLKSGPVFCIRLARGKAISTVQWLPWTSKQFSDATRPPSPEHRNKRPKMAQDIQKDHVRPNSRKTSISTGYVPVSFEACLLGSLRASAGATLAAQRNGGCMVQPSAKTRVEFSSACGCVVQNRTVGIQISIPQSSAMSSKPSFIPTIAIGFVEA